MFAGKHLSTRDQAKVQIEATMASNALKEIGGFVAGFGEARTIQVLKDMGKQIGPLLGKGLQLVGMLTAGCSDSLFCTGDAIF